MKISLIAMGNKMPDWVETGCQTFIKRLQEYSQIQVIEIPLIKRGKNSDVARILEKETQLMKDFIPAQAHIIALDKGGRTFSSEALATKIEQLQQITAHLCFLIGGPEGFTSEMLQLCHEKWSLSLLTFPHTIARLVLLETLYRSCSILQHHPYHK